MALKTMFRPSCVIRYSAAFSIRCSYCQNVANRQIQDLQKANPQERETDTAYTSLQLQVQSLKSRSDRRMRFGGSSLIDSKYFKRKDSLIGWLSHNIVHNDELLLAVNKHPGTPVFGSTGGQGDVHAVSIADVLPELRDIFGCPNLDIALGNPRPHSGVVILSKSEEARKRLQKCVTTAQTQKLTHLKYLLVTSGIPRLPTQGQKETLSFVRQKFDERVMSVVTRQSSQSARQRGQEVTAMFDTTPLVINDQLQCALLQICVTKAKWECMEVYCTEKLCSVLGDQLYSGRVQTLLGTLVHVEPKLAKLGTQTLSKPLKRSLGIHDKDLHHVPLHLHRHQVELVGFPSKRSPNMMITAPLPDYFQATMDKLDLHPDVDYELNS